MRENVQKYPKLILFALLMLLLLVSYKLILTGVGSFLVHEDLPRHADAAVVLNTGVEYPYRLLEAAQLYKEGHVDQVVINGNRKSKLQKQLETEGFQFAAPWYEDSVRILELKGVPRDKIQMIEVPDAYDTISEAEAVGVELIQRSIYRITVTTSKSHTSRASYIWKNAFPKKLEINTAGARQDPFSAEGWWKDARQIRWVLAEYGARVFYYWKKITGLFGSESRKRSTGSRERSEREQRRESTDDEN